MKPVALICCVAWFVFFSCSSESNPEAEKASLPVVQHWLTLFDEQKFDDAWNGFSGTSQRVLTDSSYADLKAKRSACGKLISRKFVFSEFRTWLEDGKYKGKFVIHKFESDFENAKSVSEFVTTILEGD